MPVVLVLLVGALEAARLLLATVALTSGVMLGAQYGTLSIANSTDTAGIVAAVRTETTPIGGTTSNPAVTTSTGTDLEAETFVTVQATYTWSALFDYPGLPRTVSITRSATMQVRR